MKFLFFTRSNGDVDNMPNNTGLVTKAQRREFIGDDGADNFKIFDEKDAPKKPRWNGAKYISGPLLDPKTLRSQLMVSFEVLANGKVYDFSTESKNNFKQLYDLLKDNVISSLPWRPKGSTENIDHDLDQAKQIVIAGLGYLQSVDAAAQADKAAIENGDYSLSGLTAILNKVI